MFEGYKVVFVEDDLPVRVSLTQTLELEGFTVLPCRSAEEALRSRGGGTLDLAVGGVQRVGHWSAFLQGYLCNLLNPKATLFFLAVFTQVLSLDSSFAEKLWYAGIIVGLFLADGIVITLAESFGAVEIGAPWPGMFFFAGLAVLICTAAIHILARRIQP